VHDLEVLISGAGIAGPALAYCLRKHGFRPTVVERAPAPRPGGQAVDVRGAARTVIEWMGWMERVRAVALEQKGFACVDADGRVEARMPTELFGGEGIISELEILRGDLTRVFYDASAPVTAYLFDDTITRIDQDADGVTVAFERAATRRFDLVIGADGLHSTVRGLAFAPESRCVRPLGCYLSWFTAPIDFDLDGWYLMHNAPGGRVASVRGGRVPGESKISLAFRAESLAYDRRDLAQHKDILARRFAGVGWQVPRMLAAMHDASDFVFDALGQVRLDGWTRGRIALLGDAAWCPTPLTGLGTSLALVGAYVLAGELAAAAGDHRIAFPRYDAVMKPYVTRGQQLAPGGVAGFAPNTAVGIWLRTASMRWMSRWPLRPLVAGQFAKAGDIALPDYGRGRPVSSTAAHA
jgi:2-polyprenyl-6-methoxyphenol hydroxylase-like FAD-dependent oxidoreductase